MRNRLSIQTPVASEYNYETKEEGKVVAYVELLPLDGIEQIPQKDEVVNDETGMKSIDYKTNNPKLFWTQPG